MATDNGNPADLLNERLAPMLAIANRTRFYHLVATFERMTADAVRVGGDGPPKEEAIRFRHSPELTFSPGDVESATVKKVPRDYDNPQGPSRALVELTTTFLGLTGAASPLPLYVAEEVNFEDEELSAKRDFLDVFHHRLVSILYRSVIRYSPVRMHKSTADDVWLNRAFSLSGMDPQTYVSKSVIPPSDLLRIAPLVVRRGRGARTLERALNIVLEEHLGPTTTLRLSEFAGGWVPVHSEQRCALGLRNHMLGHTATLGVKVFDRSGRFQVDVGPVDAHGREDFSENGIALRKLAECVKLVVREPLDFDVKLDVSEGATRPFRLSSRTPNRLGLNTRLAGTHEGETIMMRNVGRFS